MLERLGRWSSNTQRILLVLGCLLLYCVWFIRVPLTEIDEVRYSEATRYMVATQNYMIPHFNGAYRFQKPILYYWIQSVSIRLFGVNEFAARFPSGVIAILLVLLLHAFLLYWLPRRVAPGDAAGRQRARGAALLGAIALATMPLIAIWARGATTDITLTFFISCALLAMLHADLLTAEEPDTPGKSRGWYVLSAAAMGLAFLTKGPMGLAIPGLAWLVYHAMQRNLGAEARRVPWGWAALVFVLVAAPWYIATYHYVKMAFITHFFMDENLARFSNTMETHGANSRMVGLVLYLPIAIITLFPYSAFLLRDLFTPFAGHAQLAGDLLLARLRRFSWVWLGSVIALFSLSKTQLPSYIQSIAAAAAILFTLQVLGWLSPSTTTGPLRSAASRWGQWVAAGVLLLLSLAFVLGPLYALYLGNEGKVAGSLGGALIPLFQGEIGMCAVVLTGAFLLIGLALNLLRGDAGRLISHVTISWIFLWTALVLAVAPGLIRASYQYPMQLGEYIRWHTPPNEPVLVYAKNPSEALIYYAQRPLKLYSKPDTLTPSTPTPYDDAFNDLWDSRQRFLVLTDASQLKTLRVGHTLTHAGSYFIIEIDPREIMRTWNL
jgi:4-amino-4-deoxy-L-arabinose transferase-like glycosyltransferase